MSDIVIRKRNEVYLELECEAHISMELSEYFTFEVPDAKFMQLWRKLMKSKEYFLVNTKPPPSLVIKPSHL